MEEQRTFVDWTEDEVLQWLLKLDLVNDYSELFRGVLCCACSVIKYQVDAITSLVWLCMVGC